MDKFFFSFFFLLQNIDRQPPLVTLQLWSNCVPNKWPMRCYWMVHWN